MKVSLPVSAFAEVDRLARLRAQINARINGLSNYFINSLGRDSRFLVGFEDEVLVLQSLVYRLDTISVISSVYDEVRSAFRTFPISLALHCVKVFGSFSKKKYDSRLKLRNLKYAFALAGDAEGSSSVLSELSRRIDDEEYSVMMQDRFLKSWRDMSVQGRRAEVMRRLCLEVESRSAEGWFFLFNTLTVAPDCISKVFPDFSSIRGDLGPLNFRVDGNVWSDYVREVDGLFACASHGSARAGLIARKGGSEYHSYFAVVEEGSRNGRLHIHVVHCFKDLPVSFADPNYGRSVPYYREVSAMKRFWTYGYSSPCAVRFSDMDAYGVRGWRWPVKRVGEFYSAVPARPVCAIVFYVSKYLTKALSREKEVGCIWRIRLSRNLGRSKLKLQVLSMPLNQRLTLLSQPRMQLRCYGSRLPRLLTRRLLLRSLPRSLFIGLYRRALVRPVVNILRLYRDSIQMTRGFNLQSLGSTLIRSSRVQAVFSFFCESSFKVPLAGASYA